MGDLLLSGCWRWNKCSYMIPPGLCWIGSHRDRQPGPLGGRFSSSLSSCRVTVANPGGRQTAAAAAAGSLALAVLRAASRSAWLLDSSAWPTPGCLAAEVTAPHWFTYQCPSADSLGWQDAPHGSSGCVAADSLCPLSDLRFPSSSHHGIRSNAHQVLFTPNTWARSGCVPDWV